MGRRRRRRRRQRQRLLASLASFALAAHFPFGRCIQTTKITPVTYRTRTTTTTTTTTTAAAAAKTTASTSRRIPPATRADNDAGTTIWADATIDYSAANDYHRSHYLHVLDGHSDRPYFWTERKGVERVYDARRGVGAAGPEGEGSAATALERCGFALVRSSTAVTDWTERSQLEEIYLPELRSVLLSAFREEEEKEEEEENESQEEGFDNDNDDAESYQRWIRNGMRSRISHVSFYQPMLRGEGLPMSQPRGDGSRTSSLPTSPVASMVHIDTDFGAHDLEGMLDLFERNRIAEKGDGGGGGGCPFPRKEIFGAIRDGRKRFAVVNCWRNADPNGRPIERCPLGLLLPRYDDDCSDNDDDNDDDDDDDEGRHGNGRPRRRRPCFPESAPNRRRSRWYTYPRMTSDELLLFKQYDRRLDRSSDIWHCTLRPPTTLSKVERERNAFVAAVPKRRSFDVRAFIVFDELVPERNDRFGLDRVRPVLTLEESGCFCDEQARRLGGVFSNDGSEESL